ncbi:MAG: hypothetical protein JNJ49_05795 [Bdellovibrionaceae bacterium]|nr:hypothetical protein [Pseudobdellovibrionaceae bacterium]
MRWFKFYVMAMVSAMVMVVSSLSGAAPKSGRHFDRAIFVIFENENYSSVISEPFFKELAQKGANFTDFRAITHPSQANYIALTSGATHRVLGDMTTDLNVSNIADLLEAKGLSWRVYAEDYPGNCYTGDRSGDYVRKHNPFISYVGIQKNSARCDLIVNAKQFDQDAANGDLPHYVFYVPNMKNDGHDTSVAYADKWYRKKFAGYLNDQQFMTNTILISTFDESGLRLKNQIYTSIVGPDVKPGTYSETLNLYSLLRLVEDNWNLGNLGREDATAPSIPEKIWR